MPARPIAPGAGPLTCVISDITLTPVTKTQVYLRREELDALHAAAERSGRSVADLVREAVRRVWLRGEASGPVAIWDGPVAQSSADHDRIYDRR